MELAPATAAVVQAQLNGWREWSENRIAFFAYIGHVHDSLPPLSSILNQLSAVPGAEAEGEQIVNPELVRASMLETVTSPSPVSPFSQ
jgi:hypothetical protein